MKFKKTILCAMVICVVGLTGAMAQEGGGSVNGATLRPALEDAKLKGCKIAKPGDYSVKVGDLIELDYSYPVVPTAMPKKLDCKFETKGVLAHSPLGTRRVITPKLIGVNTIAFYFDAKMEGAETLTLIIDENEYTYKFKITK